MMHLNLRKKKQDDKQLCTIKRYNIESSENQKTVFMKKSLSALYCILSLNLISQTVTLDGYIYLQKATNHGDVEIILERTAPYQIFDTIYSNSSGYYTKEIESGIYNLTYQKPNYFIKYLYGISCYVDITIDTDTLMIVSSLIKVPSMIPTIQEAIDVAQINDTILVSPGVYYENINFLGKQIFVTSNFLFSNDTADINNTIIDGSNDGSVVVFDSWVNNNTILNGFSIRNGKANGSYPNYFGGGIKCHQASPTLTNLKVYNNETIGGGGGGIICLHSNAVLKNIEVFGNSAGTDGGGIELFYGSTTLENILIHNNTSNHAGGGLWIREMTTTIRNSTICNNNVEHHDPYTQGGAGIYVFGSNVSIHNSIISDNTGSEGIHVASGDSPLVNFCNLWNNELGNYYQCNPLYGNNITINANADSCDAFYNIQLNPQYLNSENGDFRIMGISPCIDAGSNTYVLEMVDLDGNERISDGNNDGDTIVDMGAYEYTCYLISIAQQPGSFTECEGEDVTFEISTQGETPFFQWQKDGTIIPGATDSTYTVYDIIMADSGEYRCKIWNICDTLYSENGYLSVDPLPTQPSAILGNTDLCQDSPNSNYTATGATYVDSYIWEISPDTAGVIMGADSTITVDWDENFSGLATITVSGVNGCGIGLPSEIVVLNNPLLPVVININASSNPACEDEEIIFAATPENEGAEPIYQWQLNGVNVGSNVPIYTLYNPASDDEVVCILTSSEMCTTNNPATSGIISMIVFPSPIVHITATPNDTVCITNSVILDAGNPGSTYEWSTGESSQQIEVENQSGPEGGVQSYWVIVTDNNDCQTTADNNVYFDPCTGIFDHTSNFAIEIFPNPTYGSVTIKAIGLITEDIYVLTNQYGVILETESLNEIFENDLGKLDLSKYHKGIYFLKIQGKRGENIIIEKLVKI